MLALKHGDVVMGKTVSVEPTIDEVRKVGFIHVPMMEASKLAALKNDVPL